MKSILPVARICYAALSSIALVAVDTRTGGLEHLGVYTYLVGIGTAISVVATLGLDKFVAMHIARQRRLIKYPRWLLVVRLVELAILAISLTLLSPVSNVSDLVGIGTFVISRILYNDLESIYIAGGAPAGRLVLALLTNAGITSAGLYLGGGVSGLTMLYATALGNLVAAVFLPTANLAGVSSLGPLEDSFERLTRKTSGRPGHASRKHFRERITLPRVRIGRGRHASANPGDPLSVALYSVHTAFPIALSNAIGLIYQRSDLAILAAAHTSTAAVGQYGLISRGVDALALVRGAISQQEIRELAPALPRARLRLTRTLARKTTAATLPLAITIGVAATALSAHVGRVERLLPPGLMLAAAVTGTLVMSHLPTVTIAYSDPRTRLLLVGSIIATALVVPTKIVLVTTFGITGAAIGLGVAEWISCLVFWVIYAGWKRARTSGLVFLPLGASLSVLIVGTLVIK